jgi:hypothetical protein
MKCRACGAEIAEKAIVCYRCGAPTAELPVKHDRRAPARSAVIPIVIAVVLVAAAVALWYVTRAQ